jgi:hypothetical protein
MLWQARQGNRPLIGLSALLLYSEQSEHSDSIVYSRTISSMKMSCVQLNTSYQLLVYPTLHTERLLYQQAQISSFNIQGISDQDVTL